MTKVMRPALRYFGGKWLAGSWIVGNLPPHECYVELNTASVGKARRVCAEVIGD
jgi:hypothetical protein